MCLSIENGFKTNDTFVETLCVEKGMVWHLPYHNARMNRTRTALFGATDTLDLADYIHPEPYQERTKCRVEYARNIIKVEYVPYRMRPVASLRLVVCDTIDYTYKSTDRRRLNELFDLRDEADDTLIVRRGLLTDTSICNIALWNGTEWLTPARPLLQGTERAFLLDKGLIRPVDLVPSDLRKGMRVRLFNALIHFSELEFCLSDAGGAPLQTEYPGKSR